MKSVFCCSLVALAVVMGASRPASAQNKPIVVCSTTQVADFTRQVVGDRWEVRSVLGPGVDPHLYKVTPKDQSMISDADLCLDNGWHLEGNDWMRKMATDAGVEVVVSCVTGITAHLIEESGKPTDDPHAWFTPDNAAVYVRNIYKAVSKLDPDHANEYRARTELYLRQLQTLDSWIEKEVNAIPANRRVLVTSHDAFNYFCQRYKFKAAAPLGWSTGPETGGGLSARRRAEVIKSIREFGVKSIFLESTVSPTLIEEIAREAGVKIGGKLYSDSMGKQGSAGETYIGMMRENVLTIVQALK